MAKSKSLFIVSLNFIEISEDLGNGIALNINHEENDNFPTIYLTNNKKVVSKFINDDFLKGAGILESSAISNSNLVCYSHSEFDINDIDAISFLNAYLEALKSFCLTLWLFKDNSTDFEIGFLQYVLDRRVYLSSNVFTGHYLSAKGLKHSTTFSKGEIEHILNFFTDNISIYSKKEKYSGISKGLDKVEVCLYFLQSARQSHDLGIKIANYCTCFESLFSNDTTELSHKLSERVAYFIENDSVKRVEIFKKLKKAYTIRSIIVHGSTLKSTIIQDLEEISIFCDEILRQILNKIFELKDELNPFNKSNDKFEEYFLNLVLGVENK